MKKGSRLFVNIGLGLFQDVIGGPARVNATKMFECSNYFGYSQSSEMYTVGYFC